MLRCFLAAGVGVEFVRLWWFCLVGKKVCRGASQGLLEAEGHGLANWLPEPCVYIYIYMYMYTHAYVYHVTITYTYRRTYIYIYM